MNFNSIYLQILTISLMKIFTIKVYMGKFSVGYFEETWEKLIRLSISIVLMHFYISKTVLVSGSIVLYIVFPYYLTDNLHMIFMDMGSIKDVGRIEPVP